MLLLIATTGSGHQVGHEILLLVLFFVTVIAGGIRCRRRNDPWADKIQDSNNKRTTRATAQVPDIMQLLRLHPIHVKLNVSGGEFFLGPWDRKAPNVLALMHTKRVRAEWGLKGKKCWKKTPTVYGIGQPVSLPPTPPAFSATSFPIVDFVFLFHLEHWKRLVFRWSARARGYEKMPLERLSFTFSGWTHFPTRGRKQKNRYNYHQWSLWTFFRWPESTINWNGKVACRSRQFWKRWPILLQGVT